MLLLIARVCAVVFTLMVVAKSYLSYRSHRESLVMTAFWSITWIIITVVAFFPSVVDRVLRATDARGGSGTILSVAFVFIYFVVYRVYAKADRTEKQLNKLIRDLALKNMREDE